MAQEATGGLVVLREPSVLGDERWTAVQRHLNDAMDKQSEVPCRLWFVDTQAAASASASASAESNLEPGMAAAARTYRTMERPAGYRCAAFLYVDERSAASMLDKATGDTSVKKVPYVITVDQNYGAPPDQDDDDEDDEEDEERQFRGWFKVSVDSVAVELFRSVEDDTLSLFELGGHSKEDDVWRDPSPSGLFKGAG